MSLNEHTRLSLLHLAYDILHNRATATNGVVTAEKVVEEAEKLERFVAQHPKKVGEKAVFLTETTKE